MSENDLQSVIQQYYDAPISSRMLPSMVLPGSAPATVYKDQVEAMVARICRYGALAGADTGSTVINILLPRGVVLVDGFTAGFEPPPGQEAEYERRRRAVRAGDSTRLGWYSARGGEIGDIPVKEACTSLALVFREVDLADGSGAVPVQLMWSNKTSTPAIRLA
jgi:hypothetical protein